MLDRVPALTAFVMAPLLGLVCSFSVTHADEVQSSGTELAERIDQHISARLDAQQLPAAPRANDLALLRRVTLDLAGRVPTRHEIQQYEQAPPETRYPQAVQRLLASPDFAFHLRNEIDAQLLARKRHDDRWRNYLLWATQQNRAWSEIFTDIMLPDADDEHIAPAAAFLRERVREPEQMANDTAVLFLGVNISCAQCHDHPLVADWEQQHFFGLMSFFQRTYKTKKETLAEKLEGQVRFKTVTGEEHTAPFMFLNGKTVEEPVQEKTDEQRRAENEEVKRQMNNADAPAPPQPEFSPRAELVKLALQPDETQQSFLSRSMVNRTWARLLGFGLVEPLDLMQSENPAHLPELLDLLSREFIASNYNLQRLIEAIVLSETYCRTSENYQPSDVPSPEWFAKGQAKPLSPWQLSVSLLIASQHPEWYTRPDVAEQWADKRGQFERQAQGLAREIELPEENFQVDVAEALFFSNHPRIQNDYLRDAGDKLLGHLKSLPVDELIDEAFLCILTRRPTEQEKSHLMSFFQGEREQNLVARQNLVWALLTSPEFRFNH